MKAVVMAGGEGTRLRPLTSNQPKPMVSVGGKPCIEHIIELVTRFGIDEVVATLAFLPQAIRGYLGAGSHLGVTLEYSVEDVPAGTAGSVKQCESALTDTFLVISGDAVTDFDLGRLIEFHRLRGSLATLALKRVQDPLEFGVVLTADDGRIERFLEKPGWSEIFSDTINTGIYVLEPEVLARIPEGEPFDFSKDLFPLLLADGAPLYGCVMDGYWQDIGTIEQYQAANRDALDGRVHLSIPGIRIRENIYLGEGAEARDIENIQGPAVIGNYCTLDPHAMIGRYSVLGNNVVVKEFAETANCVVEANAYLGPRCQVRGAVVGKNCDVRAHAIVSEGAVIGDECSIGAQSVIAPNVRVYPFKQIEAGAQVTSSLIWEERALTRFFGVEGVSGLVNVDITPEVASRLAMAYGTALSRGDRVVASRDSHPAARMIKRAMIAGLASTGVHVEDLRVAAAAVNRFEVKNAAAQGGFHVRMSETDPETIEIQFFEAPGVLLGERTAQAVERYFNRQEYRRAPIDQLGRLLFPTRVLDAYIQELLGQVDIEAIRERGFRLAADYGSSSVAHVMPALLRALGVEHLAVSATIDPDATGVAPRTEERVRETATLVKAMGASVGMVIDGAAERITLIDERGAEVGPTATLLLLLGLAAAGAGGDGSVALPATVSSAADEVAARHGIEIERVGATPAALMRAAAGGRHLLVASADGAYIFPEFLPGYDAVMSLAKILELLAREDRPISELCAALPAHTQVHKVAAVPWSQKGLAMRALAEAIRDQDVDLSEGIRVRHNGGWAHLLPDPDEPLFHIYAEGKTVSDSSKLAERYRALVDEVIRQNE